MSALKRTSMQDFNYFSIMFYYIISTTYQKIGDLFWTVHIFGQCGASILLKIPCAKSMLFCFQNWSDLLWEKIVLVTRKTFEIWGWRPRICKFFEMTRTTHSNSERSDQFLKQNAFLTYSWRFLRSNTLEQFKLEKIIEI